MEFHALLLRSGESEQKLNSKQKQLFFCGKRKGGAKHFLRFQWGAVPPQQRALDADQCRFLLKTGESNAVLGRKAGTDDLLCPDELGDGGVRISGKEERCAAADHPLRQQYAAADAVEDEKIPEGAAEEFRSVRQTEGVGQ